MKRIVLIVLSAAALSSCVSGKIHKELQAKYKSIDEENTKLKMDNEELSSKLNLDEKELEELRKDYAKMVQDDIALSKSHDKLQEEYAELNKGYEYLLENNNSLLASNQLENKKLTKKLNHLQGQLQAKEDSLNIEKEELGKLRKELNNKLENLGSELQNREARVNELESLIARKDSTVKSVRDRIAKALLNFEGKGLTVQQRDGKVYVSLENSLLFSSASWDIDDKGKVALEELAKVLAENKDLNVIVEGHTDNDEFRGRTAVKDNWDLSVMRATSIVKVLTANAGVEPKRVTAAGRSEYVPLTENDSPEGKAANRRTEIIITPDLNEVFEFLNEVKE